MRTAPAQPARPPVPPATIRTIPTADPPAPSATSAQSAGRESVGTALARNLVVARLASGITQHQLSADAGVSRATIAQLETGVCDPRLSTVALIARALGLPPALLLLSRDEVVALARLIDAARSHPPASGPPVVRPEEAARMRALLRTGLLRDRNRAARMGAEAVREAGEAAPAAVSLSAIFSAVEPGTGTTVGAVLGRAVGP